MENNHSNLQKSNTRLESVLHNCKNISFMREYCNQNKKFGEDLDIIQFLSNGSCGIVYLGETKKTNIKKKVALKLLISNKIPKSDITKGKRERMIKREIHFMNKVKHKNIVNLFGIYETGGTDKIICMIMEFAKYGDLECFSKLLQKKTFSETILAFITKQILNGLLFCKNSNILHMDIKHQNLLIDENLNVKIADFSVSTEYEENKETVLPVAGTSLFIAPEVLSKKEIRYEDVNKVDIYSLGVLLYHLAYGLYPYNLCLEDKKSFDVIKKKVMEKELFIPQNTKHSILFKDFLENLLNKDNTARFSIEEALNHKWILCSNAIFEEKEKIGDLEKFLINLITDNIKSFNDAIKSNLSSVKVDNKKIVIKDNNKLSKNYQSQIFKIHNDNIGNSNNTSIKVGNFIVEKRVINCEL